jgi:phospholipid/cholesterol/gamma-HCH transport system substrate-binding protein
MNTRKARLPLAVALAVVLVACIVAVIRTTGIDHRIHVTGYFANSNGLYAGDEVRVLGVPVGKIDRIEPQTNRVKITFWFSDEFKVPTDAKAVIIAPYLVSVRAIQLTPPYTGGPVMAKDAVIGTERTAVPVEWDDFREQLKKLTETLQPTQPGGVSTLGSFVNTAADNLRGQGANIRDTVIKLSQAFSALGDHSNDLFSNIKNVSILVSALQDSGTLMRQLNQNLAAVTGVLSNDPNEVGNAIADINAVAPDVQSFVAENKESLGTTSDKLASVTTALYQSLDDIKQTLHIAPTPLSNLANIYQPAQGTLTGVLAINNFANPITFLCGAIQAASKLNAAQAAKLCVQYLAPIIKNRQYNFPFLGENAIVGATARPNELTYSEDWMRPDYVPPQPPPGSPPPPGGPSQLSAPGAPPAAQAPSNSPLPAELQATNPADGLRGLMVPPGGGR